ncbi:vWA domain-containing protein [Kribbella sp. CA-253562]|uniref:vWA domain-containing protein n=1 Tax=Kribbella sp. CA-253562 TaxID=3239942 RepID=UPI003D8F4795
MPSISPAVLGSAVYTVTDSRGLVADLRLDVVPTSPYAGFQVRFPAAAAGVTATLRRGGVDLDLPVTDGTYSFPAIFTGPSRRIDVIVSTNGPETVLDCEIRATPTAVADEVWSVRARADDPQTWQFTQVNDIGGDPTITRLLCDPVSGFTISAPTLSGGAVREKDTVTLTAAAATGTAAAPTYVGTAPTASYRWTKTGFVPITAFPACSASQTMTFAAPGVYGARTIGIAQEVWFETGCGTVGFLNASAPAQNLTIAPRPQHLALVLDRSGSMAAGSRWQHATTAAQVMANLFIAMRSGVEPADRITELVFEDATCSWHALPISPQITPVLPLSNLAAADGLVCGTNFGSPGACTPIGDGLIKAIDDLGALGVADNPHFTIVLLTDGYENSGTVVVDPNTVVPAAVQRYQVARQAGIVRQNVNSRLSLYTIGVGATVQQDVLDALATQAGGSYRLVAGVDEVEVVTAMTAMASMSQAAETREPDPFAANSPRVVKIESGVNRLAVAVLGTAEGDVIELARRPAGSGSFTPVAATVKKCGSHDFVWVDVAKLFGGDETAVPALDWQITRRSGGTVQSIADEHLLVFVDLFVRTDVVFDRDHYDTGDPIVLTARLRAGDQPVTGASVTVELARPGESLGTYLATNSGNYKPGRPQRPDPHSPKAQMLAHLLHTHDLPDLPIVTPSGFFQDGSDLLYDDGAHDDGQADDGNYANRYLDTDKEGTYTWRVTIEASLPDGSDIRRVLTLSRWVGISVAPQNSPILTAAPIKFETVLRTAVTVVPADAKKELLGPFRAGDVRFAVRDGNFQTGEAQPNPDGVEYPRTDGGVLLSRYDGGYTRIVECPIGGSATVTVTVKGIELPPVVVGEPGTAGGGCLPGCLPGLVGVLLGKLLRLLRRLLRRP